MINTPKDSKFKEAEIEMQQLLIAIFLNSAQVARALSNKLKT